MASATINSAANTADGGSVQLDSIPIVDLRLLSQSELYSLSLRSSSASRCDDVVIPIIDRSVFNESAGSRKQTYSRLGLAPLSSSSSSTVRRRTPHLRPATTTFDNINNNTDPENAENAQIVTLLKQLFVTDVNPGDLFPVKIEYSNFLPIQQYSSPLPSSPSNVGPTGQKRKRGRPRKNELSSGFTVVDVSYADEFYSLNEIVVSENVEERDREVLNRDGLAVDLVALGAIEHPYREEIQRRTEGLRTEEELLEFLKGLNGQWGSRRKKKRIVDASEFGSLLPIGWKLVLSVKKKNGQVWLYCRRYISPSGLYFVSCKGVSSYLLSLHGVHYTNPHGNAQYNEFVHDANNLTSVTIADGANQDYDKKESLVSHALSPDSGSPSDNHEIKDVINMKDLSEDRVGEKLHCNKCNITFNEKDELLQHQSSLHRRNKNGVRITDGVIIKDGKYVCQFCHKTFSERHRYNGHVGSHVRYQAKPAGESSESVELSSFGEFPIQDTAMKASLISDNAMEICDSITDNGLNNCSPGNQNNACAGDLEEANGNMRGTDETIDIVTETNTYSAAEVPFSRNENKSSHENAHGNGCAVEMIAHGSSLEGSNSQSSLPLNDSTTSVENSGVIENSASTDQRQQMMASNSRLLDSNDYVKECEVVNNNEHTYQITDGLKLDCGKFAANGSVFDFFRSQGDQDKNSAATVAEKNDFKYFPTKKVGNADSTSAYGPEASKLNEDPNISMVCEAHDEKTCIEDNVPCSISKCKVDEVFTLNTRDNDSSKADDNDLNRHEDILSWNEQKNVSRKHGVKDTPKSRLVALSGNESMYLYENNDDEVCRRKTVAPELDSFQMFGNGESSYPFSSCHVDIHAGIHSNSNSGIEQDRKSEICSPYTSATDKQLFTEDNMIRMFNDALEEHRQEPSGGILPDQPGVPEVSDEAYALTKIYATSANPSGKNDLSLSFGNLETDARRDSNRVEQERYQANSFNIESVSSNIPAHPKQGRHFGIEFPNSSFNDRAHELSSSINVAHPGRDWKVTRGDNVGTSGQDFMVGFANSSLQSGECVAADGSWTAGHQNVFEGCFNANSGPEIPSSSCFHTFGLTSDKVLLQESSMCIDREDILNVKEIDLGEDGSFGLNKNYDIQSDMLRPGRSQPVEYSFMSELSSNSLPGEDKILSYNADMEQGLDPSFWLGKDALTPNTSHTTQVTSVCVWCRDVFFHDEVQPGLHTGAIGTMCPSCSSRIPGQFNLL